MSFEIVCEICILIIVLITHRFLLNEREKYNKRVNKMEDTFYKLVYDIECLKIYNKALERELKCCQDIIRYLQEVNGKE